MNQEKLATSIDSLPVGFTFKVQYPGFPDSDLEITTDQENQPLLQTIIHFIHIDVEQKQGLFKDHTLPDICHDIAQKNSDLTEGELKQYDSCVTATVPFNSYCRFLAMVVTRLNKDRIASELNS